MKEHHITDLLHDYVDRALSEKQRRTVEHHLKQCLECKRELEGIQSLLERVASLPRSIIPTRDLWEGIGPKLKPRQVIVADRDSRRNGSVRQKVSPGLPLNFRLAASIAILLGGAVAVWFALTTSRQEGWEVVSLQGTPRVGSNAFTGHEMLRQGEWLETDRESRAKINVGSIGYVEVDPNTRVHLVDAGDADHRLSLPRGTIHAQIVAPPRLFIVETPSAIAVDLGCAYTLHVDSAGAGKLEVSAGWVSLEYGGRKSFVPAGVMCLTRSGYGPGTPFLADASEKFKSHLFRFDFEENAEALDGVLAEARNMDSITLWHLLFRAEHDQRPRVYKRLAALVPEPEGVTLEGVLEGKPGMILVWQQHLNLGTEQWWIAHQ